MKYLFAFGLALALPAAMQAQNRGGALGGRFASRGMSRPLGGISPDFSRGRGGNFRYGSASILPYAYSYYIPNYFDSFGDDYYSGAQQPPPPPQLQTQQPPVIINQYFAAPPPTPPPPAEQASQRPGDPIGPADNYYLIAYKNHSVYTALAYWVEDKTLHYVTTENTHNQASLDLIDLNLTKTLNQARQVPFSIPGH